MLALQGGRPKPVSLLVRDYASDMHLFIADAAPAFITASRRNAPLFAGRSHRRRDIRFARKAHPCCLAASFLWLHFALEWFTMSFFINLVVSSLLGVLSGLGVGGGSLLIIWLTLVRKLDYPTAKYMNLLFFLPPALIATAGHFLQKRLRFQKILPAVLTGCISTVAFTVLSSGWDTGILRKLFGVLLLITAFRELRYKKQQSKSTT